MRTRALGRLAITIITSAGVTTGLLAGAAAPATADGGAVAGKVATDGSVLNVRPDPSTTLAPVDELPDGARIKILCRQAGERIVGNVRSTRFWDLLSDGRYVSDAFVKRPRAPQRCGQDTGQVQSAAVPAPPPTPAPDGPNAPVAPGPPGPPAVKTSRGWVVPIRGGVGSGFRTSARPDHDGVDIAARKNTPIRAASAGTVITSVCNSSTGNCNVDGSPAVGGCGWYVEIRHRGRIVTRYCHMVRRPLVKAGARVKAGQIIGYVGSSGNSSGPHLHFEIHKGDWADSSNAVNPVPFLKAKGVKFRKKR